jgi:hypothetical protein
MNSKIIRSTKFRMRGTLVTRSWGEQDHTVMPVSFDLEELQAGLLAALRTEDISLISHTHGRERRSQRNIMRRELQAAIKYGKREEANPGRDGSLRWRYTHDGVVYITDYTSRHEVTSWRVDGNGDAGAVVEHAEVELAGKGSHAVLIVDSSGSMNKSDVPGYASREAAVYDCLVRDFVKEQVKTGAAQDVVVTLIMMSDNAKVEINTQSTHIRWISLSLRSWRRSGGASHARTEIVRSTAASTRSVRTLLHVRPPAS